MSHPVAGVAFVIVAGLASLLLAPWFGAAAWLPAVALPLAALGLGDDRFNLPARLRYLVQVLTAVALVVLSPLPFGLAWLEVPLLLIAITAVINFTNFMDGLDGLVAGCMAVLFTTALFSSPGLTGPIPSALLPLAALVGALLGFLLWNWSPAKVFMGDVGSTFLGAVFAGVVLQAPSWPLALGLLLVATPCSATLASACPAVCWPASACSRPTACTCSSACTRPVGPMLASPASTSAPPACLLLRCCLVAWLG
ncbi:hypothetical protein [Cyanobium sp. ATX-6F1]|uniref:hypothetical protein n=1 Tax=Cyanobium sp. ATX-6F1 TaxID=3137388 RepID=UPI0039BE4911